MPRVPEQKYETFVLRHEGGTRGGDRWTAVTRYRRGIKGKLVAIKCVATPAEPDWYFQTYEKPRKGPKPFGSHWDRRNRGVLKYGVGHSVPMDDLIGGVFVRDHLGMQRMATRYRMGDDYVINGDKRVSTYRTYE